MDVNSRSDLRKDSEMRSIMCERGLLTRANGSVKWAQGDSSVMVAVFGPKGTSDSQAAQKGMLEVCFRGRQVESGSREREFEHKLRESLKGSVLLNLQPQSVTRIIVQVLQEDGSLLACAFNGTCRALMDAGIPLKNTWASVCCSVLKDGRILVDPDESEEKDSRAVVCATFPCVRRKQNDQWETLVGPESMCCDAWGLLQVEVLFKTMELCRQGGIHIAKIIVESMQKQWG